MRASARARSASPPAISSERGPSSPVRCAIASRSSARHLARWSSRPGSHSVGGLARSSGAGSPRRESTRTTFHTAPRSRSVSRGNLLRVAAIVGQRPARSRSALRGSIRSSHFSAAGDPSSRRTRHRSLLGSQTSPARGCRRSGAHEGRRDVHPIAASERRVSMAERSGPPRASPKRSRARATCGARLLRFQQDRGREEVITNMPKKKKAIRRSTKQLCLRGAAAGGRRCHMDVYFRYKLLPATVLT